MNNFRWAVIIFVLTISPCMVMAQTEPYNPYAPVKEDPPILPNGKLNWPAFFKSARMENKYQSYFASGSCIGTKKSTVAMLQQNKVDVNHLSEATVNGRVQLVQSGVIVMRDAAGITHAVIVHPAGVSRIEVGGTMGANSLRAGMSVRFESAVNELGHGLEPVRELTVIDVPDAASPVEKTGKKTTINGVVSRLDKNGLRLVVGNDAKHPLNFVLTESPTIHVQGTTTNLIGAGDEISATGHIYTGEGSLAAKTVFAAKLTAKKGS